MDDEEHTQYLGGRWEPFILGMLTASLGGGQHIKDAANVIGLEFVGAWPDDPNPHMIVRVTRQHYSDAPVEPPQYRITVERV